MPSAQPVIRIVLRAPLRRADLPGLQARVCRALAEGGCAVVECELDGELTVDAVAVEALAKLTLVTRRRGVQLRLRGVTPELRALAELMGLEQLLGAG